jgi:hypothetical protein
VTTRFQAVVQKHSNAWLTFEKRLWATSSEELIFKISTHSLKKARILKDKSPRACVLLFDDEKSSSGDLQTLFAADHFIPPEITDEFGEIFFEALSQEPYKFKQPTAKQKRAFDKRLEKIFLGVFNSYKRKQRTSIEAALKGTRPNDRVLCDFLIKITETLMKSRKDFIMSVRLEN